MAWYVVRMDDTRSVKNLLEGKPGEKRRKGKT
jgi:hypothetical protein